MKLGSLTPEGTADIYCYACNDEKVDLGLATHLAYWGINIAEREKTEKSLTEMQIEHNLKWEFNMTTEDGKELKPVFGAGLTGLKNLGNSCYLNSILQCLFTLPIFQRRYVSLFYFYMIVANKVDTTGPFRADLPTVSTPQKISKPNSRRLQMVYCLAATLNLIRTLWQAVIQQISHIRGVLLRLC